jgi:hypothetical protein
MKPVVLLVALVLALPGQAAAQEVLSGFRGYPWGTPREAIPEIAGSEQVGVKDSLPIYAKMVTLNGKEALAGFYFHPVTGGLVEGAYAFVLTMQDCLPIWATLTEQIERDYPAFSRDVRVPKREGKDVAIYDSDCEYYAFNSHIETWTATYANPRAPGDRVMLWMRTIERTPRLTVLYRGGAGQAWADRPKPPGADPD